MRMFIVLRKNKSLIRHQLLHCVLDASSFYCFFPLLCLSLSFFFPLSYSIHLYLSSLFLSVFSIPLFPQYVIASTIYYIINGVYWMKSANKITNLSTAIIHWHVCKRESNFKKNLVDREENRAHFPPLQEMRSNSEMLWYAFVHCQFKWWQQ